MNLLEQARALAWGQELIAARRLQKQGWSADEALAHALTGGRPAALADVVAARRAALAAQEGARLRRLEERARRRAEHAAGRAARHAAPAHAWRGHFDGAAHPNPGRIGIGACLAGPQGQAWELSRADGRGDSSRAEYAALIALLEGALALGAVPLAVYGDSRVVLDDLARARAGLPGCAAVLAPWRTRALALLADLERAGAVTLAWVPRTRNASADTLSQRAIAYHVALGTEENDDA
jgi:ribonuclease HI